ncbi:MAG: hypothetical protein ACFFCW_08720 [Candidatus Hodarchaeota archaeon]
MKKKNRMILFLAIAAVVLVVVGLSLRRGRKEEPLTEKALSGIQEEHVPDKTASPPDSNGKELTSAPVTPVISSEIQEYMVDDILQSARRKEAEKIAVILTPCYDNWRNVKTLEMDVEMEMTDAPSDWSPPKMQYCLENFFEAKSDGEKHSYKSSIEFRHPNEGIFDYAVWDGNKGWEWRRDRQGNLVGDLKPDRSGKDEFIDQFYSGYFLLRVAFVSSSLEDNISRIMALNRGDIANIRENMSIDFGDKEKVSSTQITLGSADYVIDEHKRLRRFSKRGKGAEMLFNQYTNVDGLWYPQEMSFIHKGTGVESKVNYKISNIRINKGIPPEKFTLPKP